MQFQPVTIADLIAQEAEISAHCRVCGHFRVLPASSLPERLRSRAVPSLDGVFRCSDCGSRDTTAMPLYRQQKRASKAAGQGWIMPPAE